METVEDCVAETQTGFQRRRPEQQIDGTKLRARLAAVHAVDDLQRAVLEIRAGNIALDEGEASLWAHALGRDDDWILCGPDKASLRCGVRLGLRERLVSMEVLLEDIGFRPRTNLRTQYTRMWHDRVLSEYVLAEEAEKR